MDADIKRMIQQAGFIFWEDEDWKPINAQVDWASNYDKELQTLIKLVINECARIAASTPCPYTDEFSKQTYGHTWDMACVESAKKIRKYFNLAQD